MYSGERLSTYFLLFSSIGISASSCQVFERQHEPRIKNVILIIGDDHSVSAAGCYGNRLIRTPNLDRLAGEGILFTNAYSNAPVCSASRQSLLCGKYPHSTGVTLLETAFPDDGNLTMAEIFRMNGYKTAVFGKTHFNNYRENPPPDHGFDVMVDHSVRKRFLKENPSNPVPDSIPVLGAWRPFVDSARIWLNADKLPTAEWAENGSAAFDAKHAISFLQETGSQPFFMVVGFHEPHSPFNFPVEFRDKYSPVDMVLPEVSDEDDRFVPLIFRSLSDTDKKGIIASYFTSVEYMDMNLGKILDEVERLGLKENTLVIYLGDQGYLLGEHKRFEKHSMWDPAVKAPLVVSCPSAIPANIKNNTLVQFIDIAPTILELTGLEIPADVQGKSMVPVLDGKHKKINEVVFSEFLVDNKAMVTDGKWKYVFTTGQRDLGQGYATGYGPTGVLHKLYNLENDPGEHKNLSDDPQYRKVIRRMQHKMLAIFRETHPRSGSVSKSLPTVNQLVLFCEPPDKDANPDAR